MQNKKRVIWWIFIGAVVIGLILMLLSLRGCGTYTISTDDIRGSIQTSIIETVHGSGHRGGDGGNTGGVDAGVVADALAGELVIELEPLDEDCVIDNIDCMGLCFEVGMADCEDAFYGCEEVCDETFPVDDELIECWDVCDTADITCYDDCDLAYFDAGVDMADSAVYEYLSIVPAVSALIIDDDDADGELFSCYAECDNSYWDCNDVCDVDYDGCCDDCFAEFMEPCMPVLVDCVYACLEECIIGSETVEWDGSEVTDISDFFTTSFPEFNDQFSSTCDWLFMGDFVATGTKYGCTDLAFFGVWFAPYLQSIESAQAVCVTIGGEWIMTSDEISCNI